jgi:hypothetical protein
MGSLDVLPRDIQLLLMKTFCKHIDDRVSVGLIGKLRIPAVLQESLTKIKLPTQLAENVYGVRLGKALVFRRVVDSAFYENSCECASYAQVGPDLFIHDYDDFWRPTSRFMIDEWLDI